MKDFSDDGEAADLLLPTIDESFDAVLAVLPNSAKISFKVARHLDIPLIEFWGEDEFTALDSYKRVLVVDDGVETGRKALEISKCIGAEVEKYLAVPVCSREIEAVLLRDYVRVYAVKRPFVRRSLDWHYEMRPQYSSHEARLILDSALD